jgi:hypothetical protein
MNQAALMAIVDGFHYWLETRNMRTEELSGESGLASQVPKG